MWSSAEVMQAFKLVFTSICRFEQIGKNLLLYCKVVAAMRKLRNNFQRLRSIRFSAIDD